jgi:hypothetical protein
MVGRSFGRCLRNRLLDIKLVRYVSKIKNTSLERSNVGEETWAGLSHKIFKHWKGQRNIYIKIKGRFQSHLVYRIRKHALYKFAPSWKPLKHSILNFRCCYGGIFIEKNKILGRTSGLFSWHLPTHKNQTPWSESARELYRQGDRRLSAKWLPTFADRGCHVVSVTNPYGRILGFIDRSRYFSIK